MKITQLAIDTGNWDLGDNFVVGHLELVNSGLLRVWFNKQPSNANDPSKYSLDGVVPKLAQTTPGSSPYLSVDLYVNPLSVGQHTLTLSGTIALDLVTPTVYLSSNQIVFEVADDVVQDTLSAPENSVKSFLPKQFKNKTNWDALADALQYGDDLIAVQARDTYDQMSLASATNGDLTKKAGDIGIKRPTKLGLSDDDFRTLAINIHAQKLTHQAILNVLEVLYGESSVSAYIESMGVEPFQVFDQADLTIKVDQKVETNVKVDQSNFKNPLQVTAQELVAVLNIEFEKLNAQAVAKVWHSIVGNKVRIHSLTRGDKSTIACLGGTLQPWVAFDDVVTVWNPEYKFSYEYKGSPSWTITNPSVGITRFEEDPLNPGITDITNLRIGDYVVINGPQFSSSLWGTHQIVNVDFRVVAGTNHKYFDIEA